MEDSQKGSNGKTTMGGERVFLSLGSNLGDREENLHRALRALTDHPAIRLVQVSRWYETEPVGLTDQPWFLNLVAEIKTGLPPLALLQAIQEMECRLGRVRQVRWGPRTVDIDILLYGNLTLTLPGLQIPHPRMLERAFVLVPLNQLAPDLVLPDGRPLNQVMKHWQVSEKTILPWAGKGFTI